MSPPAVAFGTNRPWVSTDWGATWVTIPTNNNPYTSGGGDTQDVLTGGANVVTMAFASGVRLYAATEARVFGFEKSGANWAAGSAIPALPAAMRIKISGTAHWFSPAAAVQTYEAPIAGEYIPDRRLDLRFLSAGTNYRVDLQPVPPGTPNWKGAYVAGTGTPKSLTAKLYAAADGSVAIIGDWRETYDYIWLAQLDVGDEDADE